MEFSRPEITNYYLCDTSVENLFIAEYMPSANGDFVKVYLEGLFCAQAGIGESVEDMSEKLGVSAAMIEDAWGYWESQGIVRRVYTVPGDRSVYDLEFVSIREAAFGRSTGSGTGSVKHVAVDDQVLADLYRQVEEVSGRLLESGEPAELASLVTDYSMDPEVIVYCYRMCAVKGKSTRFKYVSAILKDWKAKGLSCVAEIEEQLEAFDRHNTLYRQVFKALGFHRNPTEAEGKMMDGWFDDMGFSIEEVKDACEKTTGIANPNLNYINTILKGMYNEKNGVGENSGKKLAEAVEKLYQQDREQNAKKTAELRYRIFTEIPRVKEINDELRESGFKLSRFVLAGSQKGLEEEKRKTQELLAEKKALLEKAGYAENATDDIHTCSKCRDSGLLEDGRRCSCYNAKIQMAKLQRKQ